MNENRRGGRVDEGAALEMRCTARYRGFESLALRHFFCPKKWRNEAVRLCFMARSAASCIARCASYFAALPQNAS